jgi:hypothetical protein
MSITITIDRPRLDSIIQVLMQRPYAEVAETIVILARQVQAQEEQAVSLPPQVPAVKPAVRRGRKPRVVAAGNGAAPGTAIG